MGLYRVPEEFKQRLQEEFGDKIRVRWSDKWNEWHVEQKVRRGLAAPPSKVDPYSDDQIRHNDGYMWIMSVKQGSKFDCPQCGLTLHAPTRATEHVVCGHCKLKGYNAHWLACHWPLDETLVQHLKKLQWELDDTRHTLAKADVAMRKLQERAFLDPTVAAWEDAHGRLAGILQTGYTGKEHMWLRDAKD